MQSVLSTLAGVFSLNDFGGDPTGVQSSQQAFDDAYGAMVQNNGGVLLFNGNYLIPNGITIEHGNVNLLGFGGLFFGGQDILRTSVIRTEVDYIIKLKHKLDVNGVILPRRGFKIQGITGQGEIGANQKGIVAEENVSHISIADCLMRNCLDAYQFGLSSFSNELQNATARDFLRTGFCFMGRNHGNNMRSCTTSSQSNVADSLASVLVGEIESGSKISVSNNCRFDHFGVKRQIEVKRARSFDLTDSYLEAKHDKTSILVDIGSLDEDVCSAKIDGNYMIGNQQGANCIRTKNVDHGIITNNFAAGFTSNRFIYNFNKENSLLVSGNKIGRMRKVVGQPYTTIN